MLSGDIFNFSSSFVIWNAGICCLKEVKETVLGRYLKLCGTSIVFKILASKMLCHTSLLHAGHCVSYAISIIKCIKYCVAIMLSTIPKNINMIFTINTWYCFLLYKLPIIQ